MVLVMSALLITTAAVLAVPVLVLLLQALAARFGRKRQGQQMNQYGRRLPY